MAVDPVEFYVFQSSLQEHLFEIHHMGAVAAFIREIQL